MSEVFKEQSEEQCDLLQESGVHQVQAFKEKLLNGM